ncbi:hypothetical protein LXL04_014949 [Taraxacum kok-saghyz]
METVGEDDVHEYNSPKAKSSEKNKSVSISIPVSSTAQVLLPSQNDGGEQGWLRQKKLLHEVFKIGVMNPHKKYVKRLNQFVLISCLIAIFIDPLFLYLLSVNKDYKCVVMNWPMAKILVVSRSITDLIYLWRMLIEFRLAYISPESRVVGAGDLEKRPKKIALHYLSGFFFLDLLIVLPIPQMIVLFIQPNGPTSLGGRYAKFLLQNVILVQYVPRLYRFLRLLAGQSPNGFIFEAAWANFVINLWTFVLAGHVIGSIWYMLGLTVSKIKRRIPFFKVLAICDCFCFDYSKRVNNCIEDVCGNSTIADCSQFIDCGRGSDYGDFEGNPGWNVWKQDEKSSACLTGDGFNYGIYMTAVNLTTENFITRYVYSSFWGLQQISTLGGNQTPSYYVGEVLFTMGVIVLGLLLFGLLIGNMQNFLQGLGRRRLEKSLKRRDVKAWMSHRCLPEDIRRNVRESENYNWAATRGVDEETLMENLPDDLQRDIRRHLFKFIKKVRIFGLLDEPILDAICEKLRQKTYIKGGTIIYEGGFVTKMIFIVRGKMESTRKDGSKVSLLEGDVCGEELLKWCLEDRRNQRKEGNRLVSDRKVKCLKNVEAFVLRAEDLQEVFQNHRVRFAIR